MSNISKPFSGKSTLFRRCSRKRSLKPYSSAAERRVFALRMIPRLAAKLRESFAFPADAEISIECNPESVSLEKLVQYRDCGINRISFGLQSADDAVLKAVGRIHTAADFSVHLSLHGRLVSTTSMLISCTVCPGRVSNLILTRYGARRNSVRNIFHPMLSFCRGNAPVRSSAERVNRASRRRCRCRYGRCRLRPAP